MIYHITSGAAWAQAQMRGQYRAPSLASEGFIHCSTREQVVTVADAFYRGQADLLLLCIDEGKLGGELRWEAPAHPEARESEQAADRSLFPHLYGGLNLDAVVAVVDFSETDSGFALPPGLP